MREVEGTGAWLGVPMRSRMGLFILLPCSCAIQDAEDSQWTLKMAASHQGVLKSSVSLDPQTYDWDHRYVIKISLGEKRKPCWRQVELSLSFIGSRVPVPNALSSRQTLNGAQCQDDPEETWIRPLTPEGANRKADLAQCSPGQARPCIQEEKVGQTRKGGSSKTSTAEWQNKLIYNDKGNDGHSHASASVASGRL